MLYTNAKCPIFCCCSDVYIHYIYTFIESARDRYTYTSYPCIVYSIRDTCTRYALLDRPLQLDMAQ